MPALLVIGVLLASGISSASAGIIQTFNDFSAFEAATGATSVSGSIPNTGNVGSGSTVLGDMSIDPIEGPLWFGTAGWPFNPDLLTSGWSTVLPGNEIAIAGVESFDVSLNTSSQAFGFYLHEPGSTTGDVVDSCAITCIDSIFTVTILNGLDIIGSTTFNAADDTLAFFGLSADMPFTDVQIRETTGDRDNEYFGEFFSAAAVPEPSSLALITVSLVGFRLRRKS